MITTPPVSVNGNQPYLAAVFSAFVVILTPQSAFYITGLHSHTGGSDALLTIHTHTQFGVRRLAGAHVLTAGLWDRALTD